MKYFFFLVIIITSFCGILDVIFLESSLTSCRYQSIADFNPTRFIICELYRKRWNHWNYGSTFDDLCPDKKKCGTLYLKDFKENGHTR